MLYILKNIGKGEIGYGERQILAHDLLKIEDSDLSLRLKNKILIAANWLLNAATGFYEYAYESPLITATSSVDFIPYPQSEAVIIAAEIHPYTPVEAGKVIILASEKPTEDITVNVIIQKVQDV